MFCSKRDLSCHRKPAICHTTGGTVGVLIQAVPNLYQQVGWRWLCCAASVVRAELKANLAKQSAFICTQAIVSLLTGNRPSRTSKGRSTDSLK